ncbi:hypothetical protein KCP74_00850 [Salmonella enterica subsp. enterica]|nr:hypothetical protein KCP74_00850 [Salmonella enterica subsp. enterica]
MAARTVNLPRRSQAPCTKALLTTQALFTGHTEFSKSVRRRKVVMMLANRESAWRWRPRIRRYARRLQTPSPPARHEVIGGFASRFADQIWYCRTAQLSVA